MQVTWRDLDRSSRRRRAGDGPGLSLTGGPRGRRMGGVSVARPDESLKPTGLMRRDAGATPAMAAGGLARRSVSVMMLWRRPVSLDRDLIDTIKTNFTRKSSAQLREIAGASDHGRWSPEAIAAADEVLRDRRAGRAQEPAVAEEEPPPPPPISDWQYLTAAAEAAWPFLSFFRLIPVAEVDHAGRAYLTDKMSDIQQLQGSALFQTLAAQHPGVEVLADEEHTEQAWSYFSVVSRFDKGSLRILAYVRLREGQIERRTYDAAGDDLWVKVE
jgi:hypothetical protein